MCPKISTLQSPDKIQGSLVTPTSLTFTKSLSKDRPIFPNNDRSRVKNPRLTGVQEMIGPLGRLDLTSEVYQKNRHMVASQKLSLERES